MSPTKPNRLSSFNSVPRVSGDEPYGNLEAYHYIACSPRERG